MKAKNHLTIIVLSQLVLFMFPVFCAAYCSSEEFSRQGKTEVSGVIQFLSGDKTSGSGVSLDLDDAFVYGFAVGINLDDHFNLNADFLFGATDFTASTGGGMVKGDTNLFLFDANVDFNLLNNHLTPMATAGIGLISFNGDFRGMDFNETNFSYNLGAGLRWDVTENCLIKALYRFTWTKLDGANGSLLFHGPSLALGFTF